ncbi:kinase-like protein [Aspergillus saccharolyticus JOP 1030-1]|uniref:Kinase-like protein n=1 Tax=Aspergillus saccharolyticus JOP 1030-1 TaxID=1450539 RepID=A0A318ZMV7_9EURO|nr:kinase-like protein [Aspergillus saccharolyticus JOP 1030-1]PYH41508.1 kinase-like protein [Aspergillus saccharolyticus JOP 1030-1]
MQNIQVGLHYKRTGRALTRCPSPSVADILALRPNQEIFTVLSQAIWGNTVLLHDLSYISKTGFSVASAEVESMRLVSQHTAVPIPYVIYATFSPGFGRIEMTIVSGVSLDRRWDMLDDHSKESVCRQTWTLIAEIRAIPQPPELKGLVRCGIDGSVPHDPFFEDLQDPPRALKSDADLRARIVERYVYFGGYQYERDLLDSLPRSERTVFTHADIAPRNIMVDDGNHVTGILDWEYAGWYPEYWEYAQILQSASWGDWSEWMDRTSPRRWDLCGIDAARKVLAWTSSDSDEPAFES